MVCSGWASRIAQIAGKIELNIVDMVNLQLMNLIGDLIGDLIEDLIEDSFGDWVNA